MLYKRGEGVKKAKKSAYVLYGCSLTAAFLASKGLRDANYMCHNHQWPPLITQAVFSKLGAEKSVVT